MANLLLAPARVKEIERISSNLIQGSNLGDPKTLFKNIADQENLQIFQADLGDISGVLQKEDSNWVVMVNANDSAVRKIFSIAHELGHYFLHRDQQEKFIDGGIYRSETNKFEQAELEANEFAGNLLMPRKEIEKWVSVGKKVSEKILMRLSEHFNVSALAVSTRLKNLGYAIEK